MRSFVEGGFDKERISNAYTRSIKNDHLPLTGKLLGIKDIINVDGYHTRCGSALPHALFKGAQASCVSKLCEAGAIVAGKTVTTEFAVSNPGPTRNPRNLAHTPGGSSSGSAAAVAAGFCDIAIGTQTTGSVIRPAGYCGVIGYKPSFGRIERDGVLLFSDSMDHVGVFASDMMTLENTLEILVSNWEKPSSDTVSKFNIGLPEGSYMELATACVKEHFSTISETLTQADQMLIPLKLVDDITRHNDNMDRLTYAELYRVHEQWVDVYRHLYSLSTLESLELGKSISDQELQFQQEQARKVQRWIQSFMVQNDIDIWIAPVAPEVAPRGLTSTGDYRMNSIWTYTGLPVVTIPTGVTDENLPFAIQIVGRYGQDERLLKITKLIQNVIGIGPIKNAWD